VRLGDGHVRFLQLTTLHPAKKCSNFRASARGSGASSRNPLKPINRRINLVVVNEETEPAIRGEAQLATVSVQELERAEQGGTGSPR
jgi:hypothetical protein